SNAPLDRDVDLHRKTAWANEATQSAIDGVQLMKSGADNIGTDRRSMTSQAQNWVGKWLGAGDIVIDATAGNGHDTAFLAKKVGPSGQVFGLDIQQLALDRTADRLAAAKLSNVVLVNGSHEELAQRIPIEFHGRIAAVMFNLGFLPG